MEPNTLLVHVSCARGLYLKNHNALDAFASITLQGKGSTRSRVITEHVPSEGDCQWDENCEFKLTEKSTSLLVIVQHKTKFGGSDVIGKVEIPLDSARRLGGHQWFALKKKKDDEKYRGEVQLQFTFSFERPSLSISNMSLNKIEKESVLDKMKRKMKLDGKHKQAEDTMSIASGMSHMSMQSSRSHRFMHKINKTLGGLHKSTTLPPAAMNMNRTYEDPREEEHDDFDAPHYLSPHSMGHHDRSNGGSMVSGLNFSGSAGGGGSRAGSTHSLSINANGGGGAANGHSNNMMNNSGMMSPSVSTAESFHRGNSLRSVDSSGFGSSKQPNQRVGRDAEEALSHQDLLALVDSLRLELQVKDGRLRDMQDYVDNLTTRVIEKCPDLLAAPLGPQKPKRRYF